jgi:Tol biopolymer transport system component
MSPDGKHLLLVESSSESQKLVAMPLSAGETKDIVLYSVDARWTQDNSLDYVPLGWLSPGQCLFVSTGWQSQGPNKDKRGAAILAGDVGKASVEEVAFIPLPEGLLHSVRYVAGTGKVYLEVSRAVWIIDAKTGAAKQVKGDLPVYDGMFVAHLSPDASTWVYQLHDVGGRHGIYTLDAATGAEKPLIPNGDTMSFYPAWSPDGKYMALYVVVRSPGATDTTWNNYGVYPGEDGPLPIGTSIAIVDRSGNPVKTIAVDGKVLAYFKWAWDSKSIAFVAGTKPASTPDTTQD